MDNNRPRRYEIVNTAHYTKDDEEEWFKDFNNNEKKITIHFDQHERDLLKHIIYDDITQEYSWLEEGREPRVIVNLNKVPLLRKEVVAQQNTHANSGLAGRKKRKSTRSKTKKRKSRKPRRSKRKQRRSKAKKKK